MSRNEQNLDFSFDLDLSKYNYDSVKKRNFSIDEILGSSFENDNSENIEPTKTPEMPIPSVEASKTDNNDLDGIVINRDTNEKVHGQNEVVIQQKSIGKPTTNVNSTSESIRPKKTTLSPKKITTTQTIVNTAAFDKIKNKNKDFDIVEEVEVEQHREDDLKLSHKPEVIDEYSAEAERADVILDLRSLLNKITAKTVLIFLLLLGSFYLTIARIDNLRFLLLGQIDPTTHSKNYIISLLCFSLIAFLLNISPLFDGFKKIFTARLTFDGIALCLGVSCIVCDVYFLLNTEKFLPVIITFDVLFILMLFMNLLGKRLLVKNILANFTMFSDERLKNIVAAPNATPIDNDVMIETGNGGDVLYASKTKQVSDYMKKAFAQQDDSRKTELFYFLFFVFAMISGVSLWLFKQIDLYKLTLILTAFCSICSPVLSSWTRNLLAFRLGRFLRSHGTMIFGRESASEVADCGVLVVRDTDILSNSDISLKKMNLIDEVDSASIIATLAAFFKTVGGPLNGFFEKLSVNDLKGKYPDIQDICFHEQLGYTFVSNGMRFSVGTDEFMRQCRIDCLMERLSEGVNVYVAVDSKVVGVFTLVYQLSKRSARALQLLENENISIAVLTTDFCLRETLFTEVLFESDLLTIISDETARVCMPLCATKEKATAEIVTYNAIFGLALGLAGCDTLINNYEKHSVYQITASIFGALIIGIFGLLSPSFSFWVPFQVLLYQLIWSFPGLLMGFGLKK